MSQYYDIVNPFNEATYAAGQRTVASLTDEEYEAYLSIYQNVRDKSIEKDDINLMAAGAVIRWNREQGRLGEEINAAEMQRIQALVERVSHLRIF